MANGGVRAYRVRAEPPAGVHGAESSVAFEAPAEEPNLTLGLVTGSFLQFI